MYIARQKNNIEAILKNSQNFLDLVIYVKFLCLGIERLLILFFRDKITRYIKENKKTILKNSQFNRLNISSDIEGSSDI